jgi:hypothetical protein
MDALIYTKIHPNSIKSSESKPGLRIFFGKHTPNQEKLQIPKPVFINFELLGTSEELSQ